MFLLSKARSLKLEKDNTFTPVELPYQETVERCSIVDGASKVELSRSRPEGMGASELVCEAAAS